MKKLTIVMFVLIAFGLVFAFSTGLYAEKKEEAKKEEMKKCTEGTFYYCPMKECDYKSDKPGKCPTCGMELKKHEHKTVYVCPMKQCNVETDKPGKCPKCGMTLKEKEVCNFEMDKKGDEKKKEHEGDHKD
jgi:predicted RNA-binding Zn-ribbon protein involved in translation (DUF1610 family)